jgi:hypothetical protein
MKRLHLVGKLLDCILTLESFGEHGQHVINFHIDRQDNCILNRIHGGEFAIVRGLFAGCYYTVSSYQGPELITDGIYLRGYDKGDDALRASYYCENEEEALFMLSEYHFMLKRICLGVKLNTKG